MYGCLSHRRVALLRSVRIVKSEVVESEAERSYVRYLVEHTTADDIRTVLALSIIKMSFVCLSICAEITSIQSAGVAHIDVSENLIACMKCLRIGLAKIESEPNFRKKAQFKRKLLLVSHHFGVIVGLFTFMNFDTGFIHKRQLKLDKYLHAIAADPQLGNCRLVCATSCVCAVFSCSLIGNWLYCSSVLSWRLVQTMMNSRD